MDTPESDDGALHAIFGTIPLDVIMRILTELRRLAEHRGAIPPEVRARAQRLADDPVFSLAEHPVIARILAAP